jgi:adenylate cyclase
VISASTARSETYLQALRKRRKTLSARMSFEHAPDLLWPIISNTDQVNAAAGMPAVTILTRALPQGGSELSVETTDLGLPLRYEELPYEWSAPHFLRVERIYTQGPALYICFEVQLTPTANGGSEVLVQIHIVPKLPLFLLQPKLNGVLKSILKVYEQAAQRLRVVQTQAQARRARPDLPFLTDPSKKATEILALITSWAALSEDRALLECLATYIYTAPPQFVQKLRPFELARSYELDPQKTLVFFLEATVAGFFNMSWDLLCPSCLGSKSRESHLKDINPEVHCDACGIDFGVRFDENFELTFYPVPTVRALNVFDFCAGSPANTAHLLGQHNLWPGQSREFKLELPPGFYRFRSLSMKNSQYFEVLPEGGKTQWQLDLPEELSPVRPLELARSFQLQVQNPREIFQTLQIENLAWRANRVTAAYVTNLQVFRNLFSSEVLRPGVNLEVSNLSIMFTDLKDSTAMYEMQGDAFAFNLVQEHFDIMTALIAEYAGGIVKTIGDAVMAVFSDPVQALTCAICIQEEFQQWNREWGKDSPDKKVILKMGLHHGPSIALNLNERLDYFGTTINKAARIQGESIGDDIVISQDFLALPGIQPLLPESYFEITPFEKNLKGLSGQTLLYRIEWREKAQR